MSPTPVGIKVHFKLKLMSEAFLYIDELGLYAYKITRRFKSKCKLPKLFKVHVLTMVTEKIQQDCFPV